MGQDESSADRGCRLRGVSLLRILGGAVLALVVVEVIKSLPDVKRYWRIRHM